MFFVLVAFRFLGISVTFCVVWLYGGVVVVVGEALGVSGFLWFLSLGENLSSELRLFPPILCKSPILPQDHNERRAMGSENERTAVHRHRAGSFS